MTRGFLEVVQPLEPRFYSHQQVTDALLLGLAIERKGSLATLDKAIRHLAGSDLMQHVTLIDG
jgi:predicted nucleic acid-binding protein